MNRASYPQPVSNKIFGSCSALTVTYISTHKHAHAITQHSDTGCHAMDLVTLGT